MFLKGFVQGVRIPDVGHCGRLPAATRGPTSMSVTSRGPPARCSNSDSMSVSAQSHQPTGQAPPARCSSSNLNLTANTAEVTTNRSGCKSRAATAGPMFKFGLGLEFNVRPPESHQPLSGPRGATRRPYVHVRIQLRLFNSSATACSMMS